MAKVGYIFIATNGEEYAEDKAWMQQYMALKCSQELIECIRRARQELKFHRRQLMI